MAHGPSASLRVPSCPPPFAYPAHAAARDLGAETSLRFGLRPSTRFACLQGLGGVPSARLALLGRGDGVNVIAFGCIVHLAGPVADHLGRPFIRI